MRVNGSNDDGTWRSWKEKGRQAFERGDYETALASYRSAINSSADCQLMSNQDKQIILSNIVASRLKLGGSVQAAAAVEDAKRCVELNPSWSKAHTRLASAYIALGGQHSNDACNSLQTAIRLDPGNAVARQMLIQELRRDHRSASAAPASSNSSTTTTNNNNVEFERDPPHNPSYVPRPPPTTSSQNGGSTNPNPNPQEPFSPFHHNSQQQQQQHSFSVPDEPIDDSLSLMDRVRYYYGQAIAWYNGQSEDMQFLIKLIGGFLLLYVLFGGRFGLDQVFRSSSSSSSHHPQNNQRGNYGSGNAYDQYRRRANNINNNNNDYHNDYRYNARERYYDDYYGSTTTSSYYSSGGSSMLESAIPLLIMAGVAYVCHLNGINPFQALFMMNLMGGGRRRMMMGPGFGGGGLYGYPGGLYRRGFGPGARRGRYW